MKLIVDKYKNVSVNTEFDRLLKRPVEKTEITQMHLAYPLIKLE